MKQNTKNQKHDRQLHCNMTNHSPTSNDCNYAVDAGRLVERCRSLLRPLLARDGPATPLITLGEALKCADSENDTRRKNALPRLAPASGKRACRHLRVSARASRVQFSRRRAHTCRVADREGACRGDGLDPGGGGQPAAAACGVRRTGEGGLVRGASGRRPPRPRESGAFSGRGLCLVSEGGRRPSRSLPGEGWSRLRRRRVWTRLCPRAIEDVDEVTSTAVEGVAEIASTAVEGEAVSMAAEGVAKFASKADRGRG